MLCLAGAAERGGGEEERRRNEGTGDGANMILKCVQHEVGAAPSVT
jgi:hypothetical protein